MRSWQLVEFGAPLRENQTEPPQPRSTEVLLRVRACGACHSDVHLWQGSFDLGGGKKLSFAETMPLPFTLGHEICGEVMALGPDALCFRGSAAGNATCVARTASTAAFRANRSEPSDTAVSATGCWFRTRVTCSNTATFPTISLLPTRARG